MNLHCLSTMEWKNTIATSVLDGMQRYFKQNLYTDIEIEVDCVIFKCHKVFLCAISDFFHAMFQSGMKESVNNRIKLSGLSSTTFKDVLTFYYEGDEHVITHDTVEELLRAAGLLQLECLQTRCEAYYADHIFAENALGIWKLAACLGCKHLEQLALMFILRHFSSISQETEFLSLEAEAMLDLIGDSDLKVSNEDIVGIAAIKWIKHDLAARGQHLDAAIRCICLHLLSPSCYANLVAFSEFSCSGCSTILPEHLRRSGLSTEIMLGRCSRNYEEMLVVLGVHRSTKMLPAVHAYSLSQSMWYKLCPLPFDPGVGYATCVHDNHIYISGITLRKGYMLKYDSDENLWIEMLEMQDQCRYHEMVVMGDFIYAVGGCNKREGASDIISRYSVEDGTWKYVGDLQLGVYSASAAVAGESIMVFGGRAQGNVRRQEIQAYNTRTKTSYVVNRFSSPVTECKAISVDEEAFVVLTNGTIMKVTEDGVQYRHATLHNFDRYNFGFVRYLGGMLVVGGETRYPSGAGSGHFMDFIQVDTTPGKTSVLSHQLFSSASATCCCMLILRRTAFPKLTLQSHSTHSH